MRILRIFLAASALLALACLTPAQQPKKRHLLCIGEVKGFEHDSVSHAFATIERLGYLSGEWDTYIRTDCELITKKDLGRNAKNLNFFDAVLFYTTGELDMDSQQKKDLLSFVHDDGKGFVGVHSAIDTFYNWPEYGKMIGGYFDQHPWMTFDAPVIIEDPHFPGMQLFPREFVLNDEMYQVKDYSRQNLRVLARLDPRKLDLKNPRVHRTDGDFALAWAKMYGKGRVFYSTFGHRYETWDRHDVQQMYMQAILWSMGAVNADVTPRPLPKN
jgi:type 1 glutamine amidotransferase